MKRKHIFILFLIVFFVSKRTSAQVSLPPGADCECSCIGPLFQYLSDSKRIYIHPSLNITVAAIVRDANNAGYGVYPAQCPVLAKNLNKPFSAVSSANLYRARLGDCFITIKASDGANVSSFMSDYQLRLDSCRDGKIFWGFKSRITKVMKATRSMTVTMVTSSDSMFTGLPSYPYYIADTLTTQISAASQNNPGGPAGQREQFRRTTYFTFDSIQSIPSTATITAAQLTLYADPNGFKPPTYPNAHTTNAVYNGASGGLSRTSLAWSYQTRPDSLFLTSFLSNLGPININNPFEDKTHDVKNNFTNQAKGFALRVSEKTIKGYNTFCSEKHPDVSKHPELTVTYTTTSRYHPPYLILAIDSCYMSVPAETAFCYSAATDTSINPYVNNMFGAWRPLAAYSFVKPQNETSTATVTNIRKNGGTAGLTWSGPSSGYSATPGYLHNHIDSTTWLHEGISMLFNRKGFEIENMGPDGRYNTGLYGFGDMLPVATVENSRYRESAFDSFEDYYYGTGFCDTCGGGRSFGFSQYLPQLDTSQQHSGRYSLKVPAGNSAGITAGLAGVIPGDRNLYNLINSAPGIICNVNYSSSLKDIRANSTALIPDFSPITGKSILLSIWLKEEQQCNGETYTNGRVAMVVTNNGEDYTVLAKPVGNIIAGWQKFEAVAELPNGATSLSVHLQATGSTAVYFDDIRLHPFNANMKSFVYDPANLRLMSELDENNYATFYEYDDDGTLVRIKKETSRGIKTISETRSGMLKD